MNDEPERNQDITKERRLIEIYQTAFRLILAARKRGLGIHYAEGVVRGALELEEMKDDPEETSDEQTPANQTATLRDQREKPTMKWKPIETAPKDGTYILVAGPSGYVTTPLRVSVCKYDAEFRPLNPWVNHSGDSFLDDGEPPLYWMPLPDSQGQSHVGDSCTLRDQFAMAALTGMLAVIESDTHYSDYASYAYKFADAMLKAREEKQP